MASLLKSVSGFLDTVIRRGAPVAQQAAPAAAARAAAPTARPEIPGLPPRPQKIRAPTADGRAPSSPDDIDPALLKELYKVGPALKKQEVAKPTAPATGEDARRRRRPDQKSLDCRHAHKKSARRRRMDEHHHHQMTSTRRCSRNFIK